MPPVVPPRAIAVRALGVDIMIVPDHATIADRVQEAWRDAAHEPTDAPRRKVTVSYAPGADVHSADIEEIMHNLSPAVTRAAIGARAGELVMLHAAALADPLTGATAVLVAPSGVGKTTVAVTLGRTLSYLTDETAGITEEGMVLAYRKPLSVIDGGTFKTQIAPSALGMVTSSPQARLTAVYVLQRNAQHEGPPRAEPLDTIDALAELAPQVSFLGEFPRPLQRLSQVLDMVGGADRIIYREAADLEPVLSLALRKASR